MDCVECYIFTNPKHGKENFMRQTRLLFIVIILLAFCACTGAEVKTIPPVTGQAAIDFTLPDQDGKLLKLSDVLKDYKAVVLAFYPKDDTGV